MRPWREEFQLGRRVRLYGEITAAGGEGFQVRLDRDGIQVWLPSFPDGPGQGFEFVTGTDVEDATVAEPEIIWGDEVDARIGKLEERADEAEERLRRNAEAIEKLFAREHGAEERIENLEATVRAHLDASGGNLLDRVDAIERGLRMLSSRSIVDEVIERFAQRIRSDPR